MVQGGPNPFCSLDPVCFLCLRAESKAACLYQGTVYHANERWEVDECTGCACVSGNVHCHSERCPPLACATVSDARARSLPNLFFFKRVTVEVCVKHVSVCPVIINDMQSFRQTDTTKDFPIFFYCGLVLRELRQK